MVHVTIKLKPGAKKNSVSIRDDGIVAIAVTSPPVEGKANNHLIKILSKTLHIPQSSLTIVRGEKSREKVVAVEGIELQKIIEKLKEHKKV